MIENGKKTLNKYPKVIVLILSYNGKHLLEEAISSYLQNDYPNFETVVIDNGSIDGTREFVKTKFPQVYVIRTEKNLGYAGGFNLGLDYAFRRDDADYVLVTNNDVKAHTRVISELVDVATKDDKFGFVTGKVYFYDNPDILQSVGYGDDPVANDAGHIGYKEKDAGQYDTICERVFTDDVFTLVRRKLYEEIGGYDSMFFIQSEQYDWQLRAKKMGYKIMYTPHAKLWHKVSMTIKQGSALQSYYDARNSLLVRLIHESHPAFRRYFWFHVRRHIFRGSLVALKQGRVSVAFAKWQGLFSGIVWGMKEKRLTLRHLIS